MRRLMVSILEQPLKIPGGLTLASNKAQSLREPLRQAPIPERLIVPLSQHIGEAAEALVGVGDKVLKGQVIARSLNYISAPVHAPTSGTVTDIGEYPVPHPSGLKGMCIVVHADGDDRSAETGLAMDNVFAADAADIRQRVREAGIVGLGGAGFPTAVKLNPGPQRQIELLVINAAECEPYISCDEALMCCCTQDVIDGVRIMQHALGARQVAIGIEDNMPRAIECLRDGLARAGS
ncbi:MAG: RnfABCDGE type electron transport complex subunit C, partial [Thiogranum sp.]